MIQVKAYFGTDDEDVTEIRYFEVNCVEIESAEEWIRKLYPGKCWGVEEIK